MESELFIAYLIYGFVYILFGFRILTIEKHHGHNRYLNQAFKYVAIFGIVHGFSEWLTVLRISNLFIPIDAIIQNTKFILKMVSFVLLMQAGTTIIVALKIKRSWLKIIPVTFGIIYLIVFIIVLTNHGFDYFINNRTFNIIYIRYFLGVTGAFIAALGFYLESQRPEYVYNQLKWRYLAIAITCVVYGLIDGLIVRPTDFFPGNVINNHNFYAFFGFRIQWLKIGVGLVFYFVIGRLIAVLNQLVSTSIATANIATIEMDARCKIGFEMHDLIIQSLYGIKLKTSKLIKEYPMIDPLKVLNKDLDDALSQTRDFIHNETLQRMSFKDLYESLIHLKNQLNYAKKSVITLNLDPSLIAKTSEHSISITQCFFSVQEALLNAFKHAQANTIEVTVKNANDHIQMIIKDDGVGIDKTVSKGRKSYGMFSMRQRVQSLDGQLTVVSDSAGTSIIINVPISEFIL